MSATDLIAIVGPTASGKTGLALGLAARRPVTVICADSRTIYRGLDIGTAKPTPAERQATPHYGLDLVTPADTYSAAQFQQAARGWIAEARAAGRLPVIVGGTGLYVEALLYEYKFGAPVDPERRARLEAMDLPALHALCAEQGIPLPENKLNKRYVIRAIELALDHGVQRAQSPRRQRQLPPGTRLIGLDPGREILRQRITDRADQMFAGGVIKEALKAASAYGWDAPGLSGNIYPIIRKLNDGEISRQRAIELFITADWQLAKRQLTWWRRDKNVQWFGSAAEALPAMCYNEQVNEKDDENR
ncbi:tRNA (adenosine(37)-N6)-dimethylallyltransferase MiaA [Candidatus Saccharibacteria bacterium]|nr:tRNA (adenosine(37)-N6)-dimethylallyltransferase MiaA [Candidatus Saccharibacteria bacterium]